MLCVFNAVWLLILEWECIFTYKKFYRPPDNSEMSFTQCFSFINVIILYTVHQCYIGSLFYCIIPKVLWGNFAHNYCSFGEEIQILNFKIYNTYESPEHCLKQERWQGPPHINKVKQYETVLSFMVSLVIQSEFVYLFCLGIKRSVNLLLIKMSSHNSLHL